MADGATRVGLVGAGRVTQQRHLPGFKAIEGVEIVSVCNVSLEESEGVARQFGIPKVYDSWLELVRASDTNAICIGTWSNLHLPVTLAALENGKHVLCEARMSGNAHEAHAMLDASRSKPHLVAQLAPSPLRFTPCQPARRPVSSRHPDAAGCSAAVARLFWEQEVASSILAAPTTESSRRGHKAFETT